MDLESPDWDRSPSLIEEVKADPYTTPMVKQEDIKLEDVKLEDVEPEDTASTALVLTTPPASTTAVSPPPPKTPPILPPPHRNRSTRTTTATQPQPHMTTHHAGSKPPPPRRPHPPPPLPPAARTRSSLPPMFRYYRNHVQDNLRIDYFHNSILQPHLSFLHRLSSPHLPATYAHPHFLHTVRHRSPFPDRVATAKSCQFNFSDHTLNYLDSVNAPSNSAFQSPPHRSHPTLSPANSSHPHTSIPPCPAPPPAFSPCTVPPPPQLAPQALFPPLPPIPNFRLTDQQAFYGLPAVQLQRPPRT